MSKFKKMTERKRAQQHFDKDKITVKKCGKEINVYASIQAASEDTDLYTVLEKYGSIEKIVRNDAKMYVDVTELQTMNGLRGVIEQQKAAKDLFLNLPIEVRKEFNNDVNKFTKEAPNWLNEYRAKKAEEEKKVAKETEPELPIEGV